MSQRQERFGFSIQAELFVCLDAATEVEAWHKIHSWLGKHEMFLTNSQGERQPIEGLSVISVSLPDDSPANPRSASAQIHRKHIKLAGRSVPSDGSLP